MYSLSQIKLRSRLYALPQKSHKATWSRLYGSEDISYYSYGRYALIEGLRSFGVTQGQTILMPAYICFEVYEELIKEGFQVAFYPVDESLQLSIPWQSLEKCAAVLAVNYFGFATDLEPFRAYQAANNAVLIEDNTHGLLSRDASGRLLGTRSDFGIFSIRKTFPLRDGAALILGKNASITQRPRVFEPHSFHLKLAMRQSIKWLMRKMTPIFGGEKALLSLYHRLKPSLKPAHTESNSPQAYFFPFDYKPCYRFLKQLDAFDLEAEANRRRQLYLDLEALLRAEGAISVSKKLPDQTVPYAYAFRVPSDCESAVKAVIDSNGLDAAKWPNLPKVLPKADIPHWYEDVWFIPLSWQ